tara:strand:+ start:168 stop:380 length:213 start_codon:yes stop_codon:yes gene_type:complete
LGFGLKQVFFIAATVFGVAVDLQRRLTATGELSPRRDNLIPTMAGNATRSTPPIPPTTGEQLGAVAKKKR